MSSSLSKPSDVSKPEYLDQGGGFDGSKLRRREYREIPPDLRVALRLGRRLRSESPASGEAAARQEKGTEMLARLPHR
jgi:hypothetical protein